MSENFRIMNITIFRIKTNIKFELKCKKNKKICLGVDQKGRLGGGLSRILNGRHFYVGKSLKRVI